MLRLEFLLKNKQISLNHILVVKGLLDPLLLFAISNGFNTGYVIRREILATSKIMISFGTLYPHLHMLEEQGYLSSEKVVPESGNIRRIYTITSKGEQELRMIFKERENI